jgi:hypothetical protein
MKGPIHIYYQLENFYQNHRRYVLARIHQMLYELYQPTNVISS